MIFDFPRQVWTLVRHGFQSLITLNRKLYILITYVFLGHTTPWAHGGRPVCHPLEPALTTRWILILAPFVRLLLYDFLCSICCSLQIYRKIPCVVFFSHNKYDIQIYWRFVKYFDPGMCTEPAEFLNECARKEGCVGHSANEALREKWFYVDFVKCFSKMMKKLRAENSSFFSLWV
jgi:hypothetical protein